jgi:hypothetical protein
MEGRYLYFWFSLRSRRNEAKATAILSISGKNGILGGPEVNLPPKCIDFRSMAVFSDAQDFQGVRPGALLRPKHVLVLTTGTTLSKAFRVGLEVLHRNRSAELN